MDYIIFRAVFLVPFLLFISSLANAEPSKLIEFTVDGTMYTPADATGREVWDSFPKHVQSQIQNYASSCETMGFQAFADCPMYLPAEALIKVFSEEYEVKFLAEKARVAKEKAEAEARAAQAKAKAEAQLAAKNAAEARQVIALMTVDIFGEMVAPSDYEDHMKAELEARAKTCVTKGDSICTESLALREEIAERIIEKRIAEEERLAAEEKRKEEERLVKEKIAQLLVFSVDGNDYTISKEMVTGSFTRLMFDVKKCAEGNQESCTSFEEQRSEVIKSQIARLAELRRIEEEKRVAAEDAEKERQIAAEKAEKERQIAAEKAEKERQIAAEKARKEAEEAERLAAEQAALARQKQVDDYNRDALNYLAASSARWITHNETDGMIGKTVSKALLQGSLQGSKYQAILRCGDWGGKSISVDVILFDGMRFGTAYLKNCSSKRVIEGRRVNNKGPVRSNGVCRDVQFKNKTSEFIASIVNGIPFEPYTENSVPLYGSKLELETNKGPLVIDIPIADRAVQATIRQCSAN